MTVLLAALVIVAIPFLAVSALLKLSERLQDRRDFERDRQIERFASEALPLLAGLRKTPS